MSKRIEKRAHKHEIRVATSGDGSTLIGYIAVFNSPSEEMWGYTEMVAPGAFTRSLTDDSDIVCLINHDDNAPAGRQSAGTLRLEQDDTGLRFEVDLPATTRGADLKVSIERKDVTGCSFGFICRDDQWISNEDGSVLRIIKDIELIEVSVGVTFPAYTDTSSQLRSMPDTMPIEIRKAIEARKSPPAPGDEWAANAALLLRIAEAS